MLLQILTLLVLTTLTTAKTYTLLDFGAVEGDTSLNASLRNAAAFNTSFTTMQSGDTLTIPQGNFHTMGGIVGRNLANITISIDGTLTLPTSQKNWPRTGPGTKAKVMEFFHFYNVSDFTLTSSQMPAPPGARGQNAGNNGVGLIEGNGAVWWGIPGVGYLEIGENRPRLLNIESGTNIKVERIFFKDPPYWTTHIHTDNHLEITDCKIEVIHFQLYSLHVSTFTHSFLNLDFFIKGLAHFPRYPHHH